MTVIDSATAPVPAPTPPQAGAQSGSAPVADPAGPDGGPPPPGLGSPRALADAAAGAAYAVTAAAVTYVLVCLPVLAGWSVSSQDTSWAAVLSVGEPAFLLAHFGSLAVGGHALSLTPMLLAALPFVVLVSAALAAARSTWARAAGFTGGYAACVLALALHAAAGPAPASLSRSVAGGLVFPFAAYQLALAWQGSPLPAPRWLAVGAAGAPVARLAVTARRALAPAGWGLAALLAGGAGLLVAAAAWRFDDITAGYAVLGPGVVGGLLLTAGQLLTAPNLSVWAVAFMAGPGFGVGGGRSVTWSASEVADLPLVPVLAVLPEPGPLPGWLAGLAAVPALVGALIGWRSVRALPRLSAVRVKLATAATACLLCTAGMVALAVLAGGGLGSARLQGMGAEPWPLGGVLLAELLAGACAPVAWSAWAARRRAQRWPSAPGSGTSTRPPG